MPRIELLDVLVTGIGVVQFEEEAAKGREEAASEDARSTVARHFPLHFLEYVVRRHRIPPWGSLWEEQRVSTTQSRGLISKAASLGIERQANS